MADSFGRRKLARKTIGDKTLEVVYIKEDDIIVFTDSRMNSEIYE